MQSQTIKVELSVDEINLILFALGELPAKTAMALIQKIQVVAEKQLKSENVKTE